MGRKIIEKTQKRSNAKEWKKGLKKKKSKNLGEK